MDEYDAIIALKHLTSSTSSISSLLDILYVEDSSQPAIFCGPILVTSFVTIIID